MKDKNDCEGHFSLHCNAVSLRLQCSYLGTLENNASILRFILMYWKYIHDSCKFIYFGLDTKKFIIPLLCSSGICSFLFGVDLGTRFAGGWEDSL